MEGNIPIGAYHGNVANMSMNDSLQELEGGKPSVARGKQMSAKAARVDTGHFVTRSRRKHSCRYEKRCEYDTAR